MSNCVTLYTFANVLILFVFLISVYLCDVMGAEVVDQFVKSLLAFRAVDFRELFHCFAKFLVQLGCAGHSITVYREKPDKS